MTRRPTPFLRFFLPSLLLVGAALPAAAQEEVAIKALCFPKQEGKASIEMLVGEEKVVEIPLQSHEFTLPKNVPRLGVWRFGTSGTDSEGNFTFTTHATVTPLAARRQLLLFVRKGPNNEDGFNILPLNPADVRGRNYVILNLSRGPVAGIVGGRKFRLAPGRRTIVAPEADRGDNLCFASLNYMRNDKWRPFFSSNWRLRPRSRALIIIYQTNGQRAPRIHSVIDPL